MIELAIKAGLPLIGVATDDLPNFEAAFHSLIGKKIVQLGKSFDAALAQPWMHYVVGETTFSNEQYRKLVQHGKTIVVVNPETDPLVFDAGLMPTPIKLLESYLHEQVADELVEPAMKVLNGLSLRAASEIVALTQARYDGVSSIEQLRLMRSQLQSALPGLSALDTVMDYYEPNEELEQWLEENRQYFMGAGVPHQLVPRGLMLAGRPGTGKSYAAKRISQVFKVPLFRVDVATTLTKYIGESEARMSKALQQVEREEPCVLLMDEVEKIFQSAGGEGNGVIDRILSMLLWWLQEHRSRVLTVMTTNDKSAIPPELYRSGRLDLVLEMKTMGLPSTRAFIARVYRNLLGHDMPPDRVQSIAQMLEETGKGQFAHADAAQIAYNAIKKHGWFSPT